MISGNDNGQRRSFGKKDIANAQEANRGLVCTKCGAVGPQFIYVRDTIQRVDGILRVRQCRKCSRVFSTIERTDDPIYWAD